MRDRWVNLWFCGCRDREFRWLSRCGQETVGRFSWSIAKRPSTAPGRANHVFGDHRGTAQGQSEFKPRRDKGLGGAATQHRRGRGTQSAGCASRQKETSRCLLCLYLPLLPLSPHGTQSDWKLQFDFFFHYFFNVLEVVSSCIYESNHLLFKTRSCFNNTKISFGHS